jgi:ATP-dependent RNA helicase DHX57
MLNEFCQRNKRSRAVFSDASAPRGLHRYRASLPARGPVDAKDHAPAVSVLPSDAHADALFARHCAAVHLLRRLNPQLPLYRLMAPEFRPEWDRCGELLEHEADQEKSRAAQAARRSVQEERAEARQRELEQLPLILMNDEARAAVADVVQRTFGNLSTRQSSAASAASSAGAFSASTLGTVSRKLTGLGFAPADVDEALDALPSDVAENDVFDAAIEWLCLNVNEEDLPVAFRARGQMDVILPSSKTASTAAAAPAAPAVVAVPAIELSSDVRELVRFGFDADAVSEALAKHHGDHAAALVSLFAAEVSGDFGDDDDDDDDDENDNDDNSNDDDDNNNNNGLARQDIDNEVEALEAILADSFHHETLVSGDEQIDIRFDSNAIGGEPRDAHLRVILAVGSAYPATAPTFAVSIERAHSSTLMRLTRDLYAHCIDQLLGAPLVFSLLSWLQENIAPNAIDASDAPSGAAGASDGASSASTSSAGGRPSAGRALSSDDDFQRVLGEIEAGVVRAVKKSHAARPAHAKRSAAQLRAASAELQKQFAALRETAAYKAMQPGRQRLPAWEHRDELVRAVQANRVVVISGETGCGKSTQVPQFLLDAVLTSDAAAAASLLCTQPRRLAAIGVAERVAAERGEQCGNTVGYAIRLERKASAATKLLYCTTGVLLRRLAHDATLEGVTHIVVDEVHERSAESDFLLVLLRRLLNGARKDLRVVLMSATLDADLFAKYFGGAPTFHIAGRMFPVKEIYLEDVIERCIRPPTMGRTRSKDDLAAHAAFAATMTGYSAATINALHDGRFGGDALQLDAAEEVLRAIAGGSFPDEARTSDAREAVLVFLPGVGPIRDLQTRLADEPRLFTLPLHAALSADEQRLAFAPAPKGKRKVLLATNVAETSITLDDVVFVLECGRENEMRYDATRRTSALVETWVSRASAKQRRGRAGRTQPGVCVHLYTRREMAEQFAAQSTPEMSRVPLHQLCLQIAVLGLGSPAQFLNEALQPPPKAAVDAAELTLRELGALDARGDVTALGVHLASLPVDVQAGKLLLFGAMFRCVRPTLTLAAALSCRTPFLAPIEKRDEADAARQRAFGPHAADVRSDHARLLQAYDAFQAAARLGRRAEREFCEAAFVSANVMRQIMGTRQQLESLLFESGFVSRRRDQARGDAIDEHDVNSDSTRILKAVLCAALYPNVVHADMPDERYAKVVAGAVAVGAESREIRYRLKSHERVFMHPQSINFHAREYGQCPYLVYFEIVTTSKPYVRESTALTGYGLLLLGGGEIEVDAEKGTLSIDRWIRFRAPARIAVLARVLRRALERLLAAKIEMPALDISATPLIDVVCQLIKNDGLL